MLWVLLLLLPAQVVAAAVTKCDENKYALGRLCCDLCPPGHHVSAHCTESQATRCSPCPAGTFMAHDNHENQCQTCANCRDDQEVVKNCTPTSDQQCQCKTGQCYCDTENCPEMCYPCTRCPGVTLHPCTATRDTVCATEPSPAPGNPTRNPVTTDSGLLVEFPWDYMVIIIVFVTVVVVGFCLFIAYSFRKRGVQHIREVVRCFKTRSGEPGSHVRSRESVQPNEDPESGPPAPGVETTPLMEEGGSALAPAARPCPGPSDDPGEAVELMVMSRGNPMTPELAPRAVPDAHRPLSWASLRRLEQSRESVQPNEDPESGPPAPGVETTPLMEEGGSALAPGARPCPGPSDDPGEAVELMVMSRGSPMTPELSPRAVPDAHRPLSWASLRRLENINKSIF
ncbi:uncharacterized protein WM277_027007 isoform 2-T2 [Molossus nigricans]